MWKLTVSDQVTQETQNKIGFRFSESYLWFLKNHGGGTIGDEEVYSVYVNNYLEYCCAT